MQRGFASAALFADRAAATLGAGAATLDDSAVATFGAAAATLALGFGSA
jgi:hypothetical protein